MRRRFGSGAARDLFHCLVFVLAAVLLAACNGVGWTAPQKENKLAQHYIELIRSRDADAIMAVMDPAYRTSATRESIGKLANYLPNEKSRNTELISWTEVQSQGSTLYSLNYELEFPHKWVLLNVVVKKTAAGEELWGFHVYPETQSLEKLNAFTFKSKPLTNYIVFALMIAVPLFIVISVVTAFRTPMSKLKWLWILGMLFGFGQISLNWTTSTLSFTPAAFQLLGAAYSQIQFGPAILQVGIPVVAVMFWFRRRALLAAPHEAS